MTTNEYDKALERVKQNIKKYYDIAVTICRNSDINVALVPEEKTAVSYLDRNEIVFGVYSFPRSIFLYEPEITNVLIKGLIVHEAGHLLLTKPIWFRMKHWIDTKSSDYYLKNEIFNVLEDIRIEEYLKLRYKYDFGKDIEFLNRVLSLSIEKHLEKIKKSGKASSVPYFRKGFILSLIIYKFVYGFPEEELLEVARKTGTSEKIVREAWKIAEEIKYKRIASDILKVNHKLFEFLSNINGQVGLKGFIPCIKGGSLQLHIPVKIRNKLREKLKTKNNFMGQAISRAGGKGLGDNIPAPEPNPNKYLMYVQQVKEEIRELKRLLKRKLEVYYTRNRYQKRGRIMNDNLARLYVSSKRRNLRRIFIRPVPQQKRKNVAICLMVDFSGSVPRNIARKSLTILAEAFGDFIPSSQFAIVVFASDYQRIKLFSENWNNVKARIGGNLNVGFGTMGSNCLRDIQRMFNSINHNTQKLLILVSDFCFNDIEKTKKRIINMINYSKVKMAFIGVSHSEYQFAQIPVKQIYDISELPEKVAELYFSLIT